MTDEPRIEEQQAEQPVDEQQVAESGGEDERLAALEDQLRRVAADFDNFRKRAAREREELVVRANERLVKELLPILDDLERALTAATEHAAARSAAGKADGSADDRLRRAYADEAALEEGVRLVFRSLAQVLERQGLQEIGTEGKFDPHVHEALLSQPSERDEGDVIDVVQKGYKLGDRVLRPARVVVAAAAEPPVRDGGPGEGAPGEPGGSPEG